MIARGYIFTYEDLFVTPQASRYYPWKAETLSFLYWVSI